MIHSTAEHAAESQEVGQEGQEGTKEMEAVRTDIAALRGEVAALQRTLTSIVNLIDERVPLGAIPASPLRTNSASRLQQATPGSPSSPLPIPLPLSAAHILRGADAGRQQSAVAALVAAANAAATTQARESANMKPLIATHADAQALRTHNLPPRSADALSDSGRSPVGFDAAMEAQALLGGSGGRLWGGSRLGLVAVSALIAAWCVFGGAREDQELGRAQRSHRRRNGAAQGDPLMDARARAGVKEGSAGRGGGRQQQAKRAGAAAQPAVSVPTPVARLLQHHPLPFWS